MNPTYRSITTADLPAVFEVRASTHENAISIEDLERRHGITIESMARDMQGTVAGWLCESNGEVVGFCMGDSASGEVLVLAVRPEHEGRGIGKALLARTRDWLLHHGPGKVWLCSNPDPAVRAHGFYRRQGWQPNGRRVRDDEVLVWSPPAEQPPT